MVVSQSKEPYVNTHTCHAIKANSSLEKQCNVHPLPFSDARLKGITAQRNFGAYRSSNSTRRAAHSVPRTWPGRGSGGNTRKQGDAMNEGHLYACPQGFMLLLYNPPKKSPRITARWSSREESEEPEGRPEKPEDLQILRGDSPLAFSPLPGPAALPSGSSLASPDSIK